MRDRVMLAYAVGMFVLGGAFYALPSAHVVIWSLIGFGAAAAILFGVWRNRPRRRAPWLWLALALTTFCAGDFAYEMLVRYGGQQNPFPSISDFLYLITFVFLGIGVFGLTRSGSGGQNRSAALDAMIVTVAIGLLGWLYLIGPRLTAPDLTTLQRFISIGYPLGDLVLLLVGVRLVTAIRPNPSSVLLLVGLGGTLTADVLYGLAQLKGDWATGGPVDIGWIVFYACWGAAALHPSMVQLTEPRAVRPRQMGVRRQLWLSLLVLIPLVLLLVETITGQSSEYDVVIVVFLGATFVLALVRLFGVINSYRRNTLRGRGIREAGSALLSATSTAEVESALRLAAAQLLAPGTPHRVHVVMNDGSAPDLFARQPADGARLAYTRTLPPDVAAALGDFEITLICPMGLPERFSGEPTIGVLLVAADEMALGQIQISMELVAAQAALAMERILLGAEVARRTSEEYFRTLVQNTTDVILILEPDGDHIRYASPSARTVFGTDLAGVRLSERLAVPEADLARMLAQCGGDVPADWTVRRPDGIEVQVEASCRDLRTDPTVGGLVLTMRDVTDQRRLQAELTFLAFHDALTGLANRVLFNDRIRAAVAAAQDTDDIVGVLFLDLDDFKIVNDTFGHEYGDRLLLEVSRRLTMTLRPQDTAARIGGDEFAALIGDAPSVEAIDQIAERIIEALAEPFTIDERVVSGRASIGVATSADNPDGQDLLRQADLALYVAKNAGKGQWRRYDPSLHTAMVRRLELRAALDEAVAAGALTLEYQPIVDLRSGLTAGFEALVRWEHPERGRLLPDNFIEVAEESGLIVPMGTWVLRQALAEAAAWQRATRDAPYVSINVSVHQFRSPGFVAGVRRAVADAGVPPDRLLLEITESLLLRDDDQIWDDLVELRRAGIRVAIDDFGTGYSSLSYLRHVPLDALKIDRLFTSTIASSGQQAVLVDGIIRLAQTLGLQVIAEGIERPSERDMLARFGCRYGQGFLFSPPLSAEQALEWLTATPATVLSGR
ncbi:diguanylate cyclase (GGDEF)-like protein/PAS domain S-box-containing protein [Hamadaea flava]|uniref:Bifunctional diguanylate cyclase/phosphodiesterase n=1 Tax=Hamadaea flava TaxID=1742688 RepID=A0ABV8LNP4_9ACTN|nr:EAL domain-containing protein [Hamadaea flava]MCP2323853.1 diguanylate cyclase (GGDEF)-like protein/PAS domain S-box-containing protein [Hamadaea flava]